MGTCDVCGKKTGVTEVRDYGYLQHGINQLKQNGTPAMKSQIYPEPADTAPYEQGEITLKLSEEEVAFLNECLDTIGEFHPSLTPASHDPSDVRLFERLVEKIEALYEDNCVRYELAPALKAYVARYGSIPGPDDDAKWEVFRDTYNWMVGEGAGNE